MYQQKEKNSLQKIQRLHMYRGRMVDNHRETVLQAHTNDMCMLVRQMSFSSFIFATSDLLLLIPHRRCELQPNQSPFMVPNELSSFPAAHSAYLRKGCRTLEWFTNTTFAPLCSIYSTPIWSSDWMDWME